LESFMEKRLTSWVEEPWDGSLVDGPSCGQPPMPWEVLIYHARGAFHNSEAHATVPHTTRLVVCSTCAGIGRKPCTSCTGIGRTRCTSCQSAPAGDHQPAGHHHHHATSCIHCKSTSYNLCKVCNGLGQRLCDRCKGRGQMKNFIRLTAIAKNYVTDRFVAPNHSIPTKRLAKEDAGITVYEEENQTVQPIAGFPDQRVLHESRQAIGDAYTSHPQETMLRQRQVVKAVPVTEVVCTYKNADGKFYIYGMNNKVYFPQEIGDWFCCTIL